MYTIDKAKEIVLQEINSLKNMINSNSNDLDFEMGELYSCKWFLMLLNRLEKE